MTIEEKLRDLILSRYPSIKDFAAAAGLKYSTIVTILQRGLDNAGISKVRKICETLGITVDGLGRGVLEPAQDDDRAASDVSIYQNRLLACLIDEKVFLDGVVLSRDEALMIDDQIFAALDIIRRQRKRKEGGLL